MRTPHDHHAIGAVRSWRPAGHNGHREQDTQRRQNRQNPPELLHRAALAPALSRAQHFLTCWRATGWARSTTAWLACLFVMVPPNLLEARRLKLGAGFHVARPSRPSCRGAASMRRLGLLSGSPCDSRIQLFAAPSTGDAASVSSRLEPVENDHRADDESDIHDESGNRVHTIGRALRSAAMHARDRFSKNVKASVCQPLDRLRRFDQSTAAIHTRRDAGHAPKCRRKVTWSAKSD